MPIAAMSSADAPKMVSNSILKRWREVSRTTISSMVRMWATGMPSLASRNAFEIGATKVCGSTLLRTIHQSGAMRELSAVILSGICAMGTNIFGRGSRSRPPSWVSYDSDDLTRGLLEIGAHAWTDEQTVLERIALGPVMLGHRFV